MTNPNPSGGGMPKWLIILLVILLIVILGCCGGLTTCFFLARRAARSAMPVLQQAQQQMIEEAQRAQDAAIKAQAEQAARNGAAPAVDATPAAPTGDGVGGANATPSAAADAAPSGAIAMAKMPKNFPADVPILNGLTPSISSSDGVANKGMVMLSGKVKTDDVVTYYTQSLEKTGYTQTNNTAINDITQLLYTKDTFQVFVQVSPGDAGAATSSNVMITYGPK